MRPPADRFHALDALRAAAMFLGILLHGMLSFTDLRVPFWPAHDSERSQACDLFIFLVHDFRMQVFFFLAGFFGALLWQSRGPLGTIHHRLLRIVLPFGLALLLVQPALQALWLMGDLDALRFVGATADRSKPRAELLADHFLTGNFVRFIYPFHLWFLYYLLIFFALIIPSAMLADRLRETRAGRAVDRLFRGVCKLPGKAVVLAALTAPLLLTMTFAGLVDTPERWRPNPNLVAYYFLFFLLGWQLWRHRDLLGAFTRRWPASLLAALLLAPVYLKLTFMILDGRQGKAEPPGPWAEPAVAYLAALITWLMVGSLMGAFRHFLSAERRWVRYLADASYWCYLWHLVPIVALQIALERAALPGPVKFLIVIGGSMAVLLATYEWCVRYTLVGAMLNGRKYRRPVPVREPSSTAAPAH
jgi:glucan biosynthesis protein C